MRLRASAVRRLIAVDIDSAVAVAAIIAPVVSGAIGWPELASAALMVPVFRGGPPALGLPPPLLAGLSAIASHAAIERFDKPAP